MSIIGYGWQPDTGNYKVVHYDRGNLAVTRYNVGISNFSESSTLDGGSGNPFQFATDASAQSPFSFFGTYTITLPVNQDAIKFGNKQQGFGLETRYSHAYLILSF